MAYAAVVSLKQTIERLVNSSQISIVPPSPEIESFYEEVKSVNEFLEGLDTSSSSRRADHLDGQLRKAAHKLEDVIESYVSNHSLSRSEDESLDHPLSLSIDLQEVRPNIEFFARTVEQLKEACIKAVEPKKKTKKERDAASRRIYYDGKESKMVGLSDELSRIKDVIIPPQENTPIKVVSVFGMAGIGKTALAKEIFEDPSVLSHFKYRVWLTVGPEYDPEIIERAYEAQESREEDDHHSNNHLVGRYLIVLDDIWNKQVWDDHFKGRFVNRSLGDRFLLTTRLEEVAKYPEMHVPCYVHRMRFMNKEESWNLLCEKVFADDRCTPELEKAGRMIAENCDGLPLTVVTVARLLSEAEETQEYWEKVADKKSSLFKDAYNEISKVLLPSYKRLPQHLRVFFLYMGVFPQNYEIPYSKLFKLWSAEGLLVTKPSKTPKDFAKECLQELISKSLLMVRRQNYSRRIKTCILHSVFWHLSVSEAWKNKFFHILNNYGDSFEKVIKSQRRLCIHNNVLLGIKDIHKSMEANGASTTRSLLCYGPQHQYPVQVYFGARLLRVLDALTIRFYEFPFEVLNLVQLRYLSFTFNGNLPASISKLRNLQFLIVHRHLRIKSLGDFSNLPIEIWDMQELKHLQVMGSSLQYPWHCTLPNLSTLLDVSAENCTMMLLERIPNLKKLGIQIELMPEVVDPICIFGHFSNLHELETLKCVVVNPKLRPEAVARPPPLSNFSASLKKLTLSGLGYPWKEISKIASLPNLVVLKMQCYAFRGPTWETEDNGFSKLNFLSIEETDLVHWTVGSYSFLELKCLSIKHCYKLEQMPGLFRPFLRRIEVIECNPLAVAWVQRMINVDDVHIQSSWGDAKIKVVTAKSA